MGTIGFTDTETTSVRPDRRAWEVAVIERTPGGEDRPHHWFIDIRDLDLGNADLRALRVGGFHDRHPQMTGDFLGRPSDPMAICPVPDVAGVRVGRELPVLLEVEQVTRGAILAGHVVSFDMEVLGARMRANGICPAWDHVPVEVMSLAAGRLAASADRHEQAGDAEAAWVLRQIAQPPWDCVALSTQLGVDVPSEGELHAAMVDAAWFRDVYDAAMGGAR